jgi:hypothetical protein
MMSSGPNPFNVSLGQYNALAREIADHQTTRVAWGLDVQTLQAKLQAFVDGRARKALVTIHPSLMRPDVLRSRN